MPYNLIFQNLKLPIGNRVLYFVVAVARGGSEEEQTEGGAALEAVSELDGKFEGWHLQAKQDAADAKAESAAGQVAVQEFS